jgi:hypothetical protein
MRSSACAPTAIQRCDRVGAVPDRFIEVACDLLARGNAIRFSAPGLSMGPTIRDGEPVLVEPVQAGEVRRGDILLYRWERGVRAHRVVRIEARASAYAEAAPAFVVRGDAGGEEELVLADQILGRVVSLERDGRRIRLRGPVAMARRALRRGASRIRAFSTRGGRLRMPADLLRRQGG